MGSEKREWFHVGPHSTAFTGRVIVEVSRRCPAAFVVTKDSAPSHSGDLPLMVGCKVEPHVNGDIYTPSSVAITPPEGWAYVMTCYAEGKKRWELKPLAELEEWEMLRYARAS